MVISLAIYTGKCTYKLLIFINNNNSLNIFVFRVNNRALKFIGLPSTIQILWFSGGVSQCTKYSVIPVWTEWVGPVFYEVSLGGAFHNSRARGCIIITSICPNNR